MEFRLMHQKERVPSAQAVISRCIAVGLIITGISLGSLLLSWPGTGFAATTAQSTSVLTDKASTRLSAKEKLARLATLELQSHQATNAFYLYSLMNRDKEQWRRMQTALQSAEQQITALGIVSIKNSFTVLRSSLLNASYTAEGDADNASLSRIITAMQALEARIHEAGTSLLGMEKRKPDAQQVYKLFDNINMMTSAYLRNSADYFGGAIVGDGQASLDIGKMARKFSTSLSAIPMCPPQANKTVLDEIETKWAFIGPSMLHYNQTSTPNLVALYGEQIGSSLLSVYITCL